MLVSLSFSQHNSSLSLPPPRFLIWRPTPYPGLHYGIIANSRSVTTKSLHVSSNCCYQTRPCSNSAFTYNSTSSKIGKAQVPLVIFVSGYGLLGYLTAPLLVQIIIGTANRVCHVELQWWFLFRFRHCRWMHMLKLLGRVFSPLIWENQFHSYSVFFSCDVIMTMLAVMNIVKIAYWIRVQLPF